MLSRARDKPPATPRKSYPPCSRRLQMLLPRGYADGLLATATERRRPDAAPAAWRRISGSGAFPLRR